MRYLKSCYVYTLIICMYFQQGQEVSLFLQYILKSIYSNRNFINFILCMVLFCVCIPQWPTFLKWNVYIYNTSHVRVVKTRSQKYYQSLLIISLYQYTIDLNKSYAKYYQYLRIIKQRQVVTTLT